MTDQMKAVEVAFVVLNAAEADFALYKIKGFLDREKAGAPYSRTEAAEQLRWFADRAKLLIEQAGEVFGAKP